MASILDIAKDIADELSLTRPDNLVGNQDDNTAQKILRHITATCHDLQVRHDWKVLMREHTFTTVAQAEQTNTPIPADFLRFVDGTVFNRTTTWKVDEAMSPQKWQADQAALTVSVFDQVRVRGTSLLVSPTPAAGETVAYEYITRNIGTNAGGDTERSAFTADTDIPFFDAELIRQGGVWRYRSAEKQDYAEEFRFYELRLAQLSSVDGGRRILDMNERARFCRPMPPAVPDTWPGLA